MEQYVNPGNDSFASAVLYSQIYVDKTEMLEYLNQYNVIQLDIAELKVTMPKDEEIVSYFGMNI